MAAVVTVVTVGDCSDWRTGEELVEATRHQPTATPYTASLHTINNMPCQGMLETCLPKLEIMNSICVGDDTAVVFHCRQFIVQIELNILLQ